MAMGGGWVLEVDIKSFFDSLSHSQLRAILDQRVRDGVLRRTIDKWLAAGVLEGTELSYPDAGTPQGGVVSPLLANIYLHEVLDRWFERDVKPRLGSRAFMVRFADDLVMVFASERDARRVWDVLPKRLGRYGLTLHPTKTRLLEFRPRTGGTKPPNTKDARSFDLLGFTHYWARSRQGMRGLWVVKRKTAGSRFSRAVKRVYQWCRTYRHTPVAWQHAQLVRKLRGHDNYYGLIGNYEALARFRYAVLGAWRKWLDRRSDRSRLTWERLRRLLERYPFPAPVVRHWLRPRAANP
jgi:group II intron reverse transcriptase/maturase